MGDGVLVDGVPIELGSRHLRLAGWGGMFASPGFKGGNYDVPGRDGAVWSRKAFDVGVASLQFSIVSDGASVAETMAASNAEWANVLRLFPRRRPVEVTRVVSMPDGFGGITEVLQVAKAELAESIAPNWVTQSFQTGVLTFRLLDGCWFSAEPSTFNVAPDRPSFLPATGTTDTANMTITLTGGVGVQTLTNVSAGVWLSYDWTTVNASDVMTVDVPTFSVLRDTGGGPFASFTRFKHGGDDRFMLIDPDLGDNEFTVSSGKAVITYKEAYL